jgi:hypothetical protein
MRPNQRGGRYGRSDHQGDQGLPLPILRDLERFDWRPLRELRPVIGTSTMTEPIDFNQNAQAQQAR